MNEISNFILYTTPNGDVQLDILLQDENLWLTQKGLAELFGVERSVITKHLKNIYDSGELDKVSTCAKFAQVQQEVFQTNCCQVHSQQLTLHTLAQTLKEIIGG